jgi:predicted enzyme related to lactoylglutathione lyase
MKVSFEAVLIGVRDILKSKAFYESVLGVTFDEVRPPFSNFYLNGIEFLVEENTPEREDGWAERYIGRDMGVCLKIEDIHIFLQGVIAHGGTVIKEPAKKPWGTLEAKFADIDGNIFIIEQKTN